MARGYPIRYFSVIGLHPLYALVALVSIVILAVVTIWLNATELDSGLGMILFAQMFLASSGFLMRARQGHLDPLLIDRPERTLVVVSHWALSVAPGIVAWCLVAGVGLCLGSPFASSAFIGGRAAGLLIVSSIAWTLGFALPRGAAGMLWAAVLLAALSQRAELLPALPAAPASGGIVLRHAATLLFCPFLLLGNHPAVAAGAICAALLLSLVLLLLVWRLADGLDIYLVDRA